jgi:hypothetical protein
MPDHLHLIANIVSGAMGSSRPTGLERVIRGRDDPIAPDEFKKVLPTKAQLANR